MHYSFWSAGYNAWLENYGVSIWAWHVRRINNLSFIFVALVRCAFYGNIICSYHLHASRRVVPKALIITVSVYIVVAAMMTLPHCCLRKRAAPAWIHWLGLAPQGRQMCVTTFTLSELVYSGSQMLSSDAVASAAELYSRRYKSQMNTCIDSCCLFQWFTSKTKKSDRCFSAAWQ